MKAFVSWSSGKDCMYALYRFLSQPDNRVTCLLNMSDAQSGRSRTHGITNELMDEQARQIGIPLRQVPTTRADYRINLIQAITRLRQEGAEAGIFGDIRLQEHRDWIEQVCAETGISALFPLWGADSRRLVEDFIDDGFRAITVSIRKEMLPRPFLGRTLDHSFTGDLAALPGIDPCGEQGEYHTFVFDGPLFAAPVAFERGETGEDERHAFLRLTPIG